MAGDSESKIKVVQLSSAHPSFDTRIFYKICTSLVKAGYQVDLVIQHEKNEVKNGVNIIALPKAEKKSDRVFKIIPRLLLKALKYPRNTVIHFHDPELIPIGIILKLTGKKVIYDVHEDVPKDILGKEWIPQIFRVLISKAMKLLERISLLLFDNIIVVTSEIEKRFKSNKTTLLQNFPIIHTNSDITLGDDITDPTYIFYLGDITIIRGLREVIKALEIVNKKRKVTLILGGKFSPNSLEGVLKNEPGWKYVDFIGWINRKRMEEVASKCSIGIVTFHPVPNHIEAQPNKLFEYMYLGLPVIASNFPLWKEIIQDAGILVNPLDPQEIADSILWFTENPVERKKMGERGRCLVLEKYNWEEEEKKLINLYKELV